MLADVLLLVAQLLFAVTPLTGLAGRGGPWAKWSSTAGFAVLVVRFSLDEGIWSCSANLGLRILDLALARRETTTRVTV